MKKHHWKITRDDGQVTFYNSNIGPVGRKHVMNSPSVVRWAQGQNYIVT